HGELDAALRLAGARRQRRGGADLAVVRPEADRGVGEQRELPRELAHLTSHAQPALLDVLALGGVARRIERRRVDRLLVEPDRVGVARLLDADVAQVLVERQQVGIGLERARELVARVVDAADVLVGVAERRRVARDEALLERALERRDRALRLAEIQVRETETVLAVGGGRERVRLLEVGGRGAQEARALVCARVVVRQTRGFGARERRALVEQLGARRRGQRARVDGRERR